MKKFKIGLLTSSRADIGIYAPLIKKFHEKGVILELIFFGSHSKSDAVIKDFIDHKVHFIDAQTVPGQPKAIAQSYAQTTAEFAKFWSSNSFDLVFCLGDRYEMAAAVLAGVPFHIKFAHLCGGETTLGAIDNIYRDCITHSSVLHFTTTKLYSDKVKQLLPGNKSVFNAGSLSYDALKGASLLNLEELNKNLDFHLNQQFILFTYHFETNSTWSIKKTIDQLELIFSENAQVSFLITGANHDFYGDQLNLLYKGLPSEHHYFYSNLGSHRYFSAMSLSTLVMGNSSSGFTEAAFFGKPVINIGDRQTGRLRTPNIMDVPLEPELINKKIKKIFSKPNTSYEPIEIYGSGESAELIYHKTSAFLNS